MPTQIGALSRYMGRVYKTYRWRNVGVHNFLQTCVIMHMRGVVDAVHAIRPAFACFDTKLNKKKLARSVIESAT